MFPSFIHFPILCDIREPIAGKVQRANIRQRLKCAVLDKANLITAQMERLQPSQIVKLPSAQVT